MMYVSIGGDVKQRAALRRKLYKGALEELPSDISPEELAALAGTPSLLGETRAFFMRGVFASKKKADEEEESEEESGALKDALPSLAEGLVASPHVFIFEEDKILAKPLAAFQKAGAKITDLGKEEKKAELEIFALAGALQKRDRKALWLLLMEALRQGIQPENIAGILAWKARTMLAGARTPAERTQLEKLSRELVVMYHDSHRGAGDLALLMERFALTL
jgi:hypothetical protein